MIQLHHVYKTYGNGAIALRNIELEIEKGEFVFLTGPSGAGKTTLFRMICAFDQVSSGSIQVAGFNLQKITKNQIPEFRRKLGVVYQDFKLLKGHTVFENVALPLKIKGDSSPNIQKRVSEVLEQVSLRSQISEPIERLSGGEQQRVAIARALIHRPSVIVADEPTGNLDPKLSEEIIDLLEKVCAQGTTVFVATHDHSLVERRKKRRIEIQKGELLCKNHTPESHP